MKAFLITFLLLVACSSEDGSGQVGDASGGAPDGSAGSGGIATGGASGAATGGFAGSSAGSGGSEQDGTVDAISSGGASGADAGGLIPGCVPTPYCDCKVYMTHICYLATCPTPNKGATKCCYAKYGPCGTDYGDGAGCRPCDNGGAF